MVTPHVEQRSGPNRPRLRRPFRGYRFTGGHAGSSAW